MAKKLTAVVSVNGKQKTIGVWLDDETARLLESYADENIRREYIYEEYKAQLIDRKETRRHTPIDKCLHLSEDRINVESEYYKREFQSALQTLTEKQRKVFIFHALDKQSFGQIGEEMGLHKQTVFEIYKAALKKLKNFFE